MRRGPRSLLRRLALEAVTVAAVASIFFVTRGRWRAWRRNSLALGYWSEQSDLDLTLFSPGDAPFPPALRRVWRFFRRFGEWAAYSAADECLADCANPYELNRDPKLARRLASRSGRNLRGEAFVFWLRMVDGDAFLREGPGGRLPTRARKWAYHLEVVERGAGVQASRPFPQFIDEMAELLSPMPAGDGPSREALLRPHRWLGKPLAEGGLAPLAFAGVAGPSLAVARSQVYWEIWGLLGQVRLRDNSPEVRRHLGRLAELFPAGDPVRAATEKFLRYLPAEAP